MVVAEGQVVDCRGGSTTTTTKYRRICPRGDTPYLDSQQSAAQACLAHADAMLIKIVASKPNGIIEANGGSTLEASVVWALEAHGRHESNLKQSITVESSWAAGKCRD